VSELGAKRHQARERALEVYYESFVKERDVATILAALPLAPDPYTATLVLAAEKDRSTAHALISKYSIDWPLERIATIDRLVMEIAIAEMLLEEHPPKAVILDEAVELAKTFSTDDSPSFVNGVLSSIAGEILN
jgi:N utilization substance protein B